jgi:hypothetical protein
MPDLNFLSGINFKFAIERLPNLEYYAQSVNIPSMQLGITNSFPIPFGQNPLHGDKIEYAPLTVSVRLDEDMDMYLEIYDWIRAMAHPEGYKGYKELLENKAVYSDASLIVLNNTMNPGFEVKFYDVFPVYIGDILLSTIEEDVGAITTDITFQYRFFDLVKVK